MNDMRRGTCPMCGHNEVWKTAPLHTDSHGDSHVQRRLAAVSATLGELMLYVCPKCGYAQWFVEGEPGWQTQAEPYVQRIPGQAAPAAPAAQAHSEPAPARRQPAQEHDGPAPAHTEPVPPHSIAAVAHPGPAEVYDRTASQEDWTGPDDPTSPLTELRFNVYLDDCQEVEAQVAEALEHVAVGELLQPPMSLAHTAKPVMVVRNVRQRKAEQVKFAIHLAGGTARVELSVALPPPHPHAAGPLYDVQIEAIEDTDLVGAVALKLEELVSIPRNEGIKLALGKGFVERDISIKEAEQIKRALEDVPGVVVRLVEKGRPFKSADTVKCAICENLVPKSDTLFTDDGQVCSSCYRRVYED